MPFDTPAKPLAFWDPDKALAEAIAKIDAGFANSRPLLPPGPFLGLQDSIVEAKRHADRFGEDR